MNNENRNLQNTLRIVTVVSFVNISFVFNQSRTENISQIPGSEMIKPQVEDPVYDGIVNGRKYYNVLYDWKNNGVSIPLLVIIIDDSLELTTSVGTISTIFSVVCVVNIVTN